MDEILKFLAEAKTFYIATVDGDKPKVRPFGAVMEFEGKLYMCTNNTKAVYKQMVANPNIEVSAMAGDKWVRLAGKAVIDPRREAKARFLEVSPGLTRLYPSADDPIFAVFYIEEGEATIYSFGEGPKTIKL